MKVTIKPTDSGLRQYRKENNFLEEFAVIAVRNGKIENPVTLRIYGTQRMNYACVWYNNGEIYGHGGGSAGGYGYHRTSAAAYWAMVKAGIELSEPIDGRGESAINQALTAIAKKLGYRKFIIHKANA